MCVLHDIQVGYYQLPVVHVLDMEKYPLSVAHIPRGGAEWDMRDGEGVFFHVQNMNNG